MHPRWDVGHVKEERQRTAPTKKERTRVPKGYHLDSSFYHEAAETGVAYEPDLNSLNREKR